MKNPALRRAHLAWGATLTAEWAYFTALEVFAFKIGGAFAVGLAGALSEIPAAVAAPMTAVLGERFRRERLLFLLAMIRSAELCAAGVAASRGAPLEVFFALLAVDSILSSATFPAQQGLLPRFARSRRELETSAAVTALVEAAGGGVGPLIGGILLATTDLGVVYAFAACLLTSTGFLFLRARQRDVGFPHAVRPNVPQPEDRPPEEHEEQQGRGLIGDFFDGIRAIAGRRDALLLLFVFGVDALIEGALEVFIVVIALKVMGVGAGGFGVLASVETIGGVAGGLVAITLVGHRNLGRLWCSMGFVDGLPPILIALFPVTGVAGGMLVVWGAIDTLDEALGLELIRRVVPEPLMPRVLGFEASVVTLGLGLGAIVAPLLIGGLEVRGALVAIGLVAPLVALLTLRALRRIDARTDIRSQRAGPTEDPAPHSRSG